MGIVRWGVIFSGNLLTIGRSRCSSPIVFLFVNASLIFNSGNSCSSSFSRVANFRLCIAFSSNSLLKGMISARTVAPA